MENAIKLKEEEAANVYALLKTAGNTFKNMGGAVALLNIVSDGMMDYLKFAVKIASNANQESEDTPCEELANAIKTAQAVILRLSNK